MRNKVSVVIYQAFSRFKFSVPLMRSRDCGIQLAGNTFQSFVEEVS